MKTRSRRVVLARLIRLFGIGVEIALFSLLALGLYDHLLVAHPLDRCAAKTLSAATSAAFVPSGGYDRTRPAVVLHEARAVDLIVISGAGNGGDSARVLAQQVYAAGVPEADVLIEEQATSTADNFRFGCRMIADRPIETLAITTDSSHVGRALLTARRHCPGLELCSAPTTIDAASARRHARETLHLLAYQLRGDAALW